MTRLLFDPPPEVSVFLIKAMPSRFRSALTWLALFALLVGALQERSFGALDSTPAASAGKSQNFAVLARDSAPRPAYRKHSHSSGAPDVVLGASGIEWGSNVAIDERFGSVGSAATLSVVDRANRALHLRI